MKRVHIILLFVLTAFSNISQASHIVGGGITYRSLGYDSGYYKYEVTITIYEDCYNGIAAAIAADNPVYTNIFDGNGRPVFTPGDSIFLTSRTRVYTGFETGCVFKLYPICLNKAVFTKTYKLLPSSSGYTIVLQRCCQNASILNIVSPGLTGVTYFATIPPSPKMNSSALFNNDPPFYVPINKPLNYDLSATDADGDSLSYEFCQFYQGASPYNDKPMPTPPPFSPITYVAPFSYSYPISGAPSIRIDSVTGTLTGTPNASGRYCIVVCCHEWRNGVLINTVDKEFQLVVSNCASTDINELVLNEPHVTIHPNPASAIVNIQSDRSGFGVSITDVMGRVVFYDPGAKTAELAIPVNSWVKGMYFVHFRFADGTSQTQKLFVE